MMLFHGSYTVIPKPDLSFSREATDFGKGFYTTTIQSQAEKWAERYKRRQGSGIVSIYKIDEDAIRKNESVLSFDTYSDEWLDFIIKCRQGQSSGAFDLVVGGIANDDVFKTLTLFFRGFIDKTETIKRLCYEKPNIQYCFKTQAVIEKYLVFNGSNAV
ncbi:MAG: DUF3990 domain-containing protein [Treponema sp.]|jgi:hypothetical protein|nr:DUF3990 domain-containing protein [Treponema sp.]